MTASSLSPNARSGSKAAAWSRSGQNNWCFAACAKLPIPNRRVAEYIARLLPFNPVFPYWGVHTRPAVKSISVRHTALPRRGHGPSADEGYTSDRPQHRVNHNSAAVPDRPRSATVRWTFRRLSDFPALRRIYGPAVTNPSVAREAGRAAACAGDADDNAGGWLAWTSSTESGVRSDRFRSQLQYRP